MLSIEAEIDVSVGLDLPHSFQSLQQRYPGGMVYRR